MFCIFKGHFQELVIDFFELLTQVLWWDHSFLEHFTEKKEEKLTEIHF